MKRTGVNKLFENKNRSNVRITVYVVAAMILALAGVPLIVYYLRQNTPTYISYSETSGVDYNVELRQNDFYETGILPAGRQYIASLVDTINAKFSYDFKLDQEDREYKYSYYIKSNVEVIDTTTDKVILNKEQILDQIEPVVSAQFKVSIVKELNLDYDYYNNLISRFVKAYELNNAKSTLTVGMYVHVVGVCDDFAQGGDEEPVISLSIPLTKNTAAIDIISNAKGAENKIVNCDPESDCVFCLIIAIVLELIAVSLVAILVKYIRKTRSPKTVYDCELKKILNHYHPYIQKVDNSINLKGYQVLRIGDFTDMLEIRDTLQAPILMLENKDKTSAYFLILGHAQKIAYTYSLKAVEIKVKV